MIGDPLTKVASFIIPTVAVNICLYDIPRDWPWQVLNLPLAALVTPMTMPSRQNCFTNRLSGSAWQKQ